ncbi:MAG: DUF4271 domain-containing protein [Clostridium sp.]|nr:DUF4271 domain-containing protein [Clostridium sp.]
MPTTSTSDSLATAYRAWAAKQHADSVAKASQAYIPASRAKAWLNEGQGAKLDTLAPAVEYTPIVVVAKPADWHDGIAGDTRPVNVGDNSGVLALLTGIFLAMMLSYRKCRRLFYALWQEMLGMRSRENAFDESTGNERGAIALMTLQCCVCIGLLLYCAISSLGPQLGLCEAPLPENAFEDTGRLMALAAGYILAQTGIYWLLGYTFTTPDGRKLLMQGFTSSQCLLGFALIIPALVGIFYPAMAMAMAFVGAGLYILARIVFISKGFRIFYQNFGSLLYFILYLCSLEIAPVLFILWVAFSMCITPTV